MLQRGLRSVYVDGPYKKKKKKKKKNNAQELLCYKFDFKPDTNRKINYYSVCAKF